MSEKLRSQLLEILRWCTSIVFFFLGLSKIYLLRQYGLEPYAKFITMIHLPGYFMYYGLLAIGIELFQAVGVWSKDLFKLSLGLTALLSSLGLTLTLYSAWFKLTSECGCGLLGDSQTGLMIQKLIILSTLFILYRGRCRLFPEN